MDNSHSSSEDDFMTEALKEATDQHFLKESFFKEMSPENKKKADKTTGSSQQKSLRPDLERSDDFKPFGISDAFQDYIAKNLRTILDTSIKLVDNSEEHLFTTEKQESNFGSGVRLLNRFDTAVCVVEENVIKSSDFFRNRKRRKSRLLKEDYSIPCKIKVEEAAVKPEWILSKCDTKAWANTRKEAEFKYKKLFDGTLVIE